MRNETWLRLLSGLVLVLVFAAGTMFGAGLMRWNRPEPPRPPGPIEAMTHELALDRDQVAALHQIAAAHRPELDAIARSTQAKVRDVLLAMEEELRPRLRPEQIQRLETWRAHRGPPPGMGPPPPPP